MIQRVFIFYIVYTDDARTPLFKLKYPFATVVCILVVDPSYDDDDDAAVLLSIYSDWENFSKPSQRPPFLFIPR